MKKPVFLLPKVNFFHWRLNAPQDAGVKPPAEKCTKKASVKAIELYSTSGKGSAVARAIEVARILQSLRFRCMNKNNISTTLSFLAGEQKLQRSVRLHHTT